MNTTCKIDNSLSHMSVYCDHYKKTVCYFFFLVKIFFYVCFIKLNIISLSLELKWLTSWGNSSSSIFRLYFKLERVVRESKCHQKFPGGM